MTPKEQASKEKEKQMGLYHHHQQKNTQKKHLHCKGNTQQNEKATYEMGENICKSYLIRLNIKYTSI